MSKDFDKSEAADAVPGLPTHDNNDEEDDPRQNFSRLGTERILQLTAPSQGSSMIASGSTLPDDDADNDDHEKAKADVSNLDGMNVQKLDPTLRRPESESIPGQEDQERPTPASGARANEVSLSAEQVLALSQSEHTASSSTLDTSRNQKKPKKRKAKAAGNGDAKQLPQPAATAPGAVASSTNGTGNEKQSLSPAVPPSNSRVASLNDGIEEPVGSSALMSTPGAYTVEGTGGETTSPSNAVQEPPSPNSQQEPQKEQSLVMASAIDKEALKEELRQELLAEQTMQVVMAVPAGTDDDQEARDSLNTTRSSSRTGFANSRKLWIMLAIAALVVGGAVAVALIVTESSSGSSGSGGSKNSGSGSSGGGGN